MGHATRLSRRFLLANRRRSHARWNQSTARGVAQETGRKPKRSWQQVKARSTVFKRQTNVIFRQARSGGTRTGDVLELGELHSTSKCVVVRKSMQHGGH